ncbi:MAG TPA: PAS domain S-box protein [Acetobacteraceae bacterium]|nr:PAS domain S-box protein [Acetobacteraceae bacterium]
MPNPQPNFEGISEAQLRAVFDSIPTRIALLDRNRRYRYVNREYIDFAGLPAAQIIGRTISEVLAEEAFAPFYPQGERALAGEIVPWEGWLEYRQGRRYVQRICVPLRDADGAADGYFIFNRDLTELKQSEQALAEQLAARTASEALNTAIIASALDCVIAIDEAGEVVEFNPAAEQTFGYRRADVLGRRIGELIVPQELRQRHADGFARYLVSGISRIIGRRIEIEAVRANGDTFPVELTITEVRLPERRLFTAHLRDLTAARAAEAEIQRQREALHQSEKMAAFGSLLAGVAHELNNPLSIVIGNALMLSDAAEQSAPELAERARRVQAAAERCGRIVRSFLAMARQRETQQRVVALHELVEGALQLLAYGLRSCGIVVEQDISHDMPKLFCDPDQMQQVLINLLVNAGQALEEQPQPRRVRIDARADGEVMELTVSDSGPGIPEAIRARIFDPFFTTKPIGAGTGIGLGVSRGIVEAHGGTLTLASAEGGARFIVRLPLRDANHVTNPAAQDHADAAVSRGGKSVLVIDDEAEVGRLLSEMLSAQAFRCDVVGSGAAAQALLERHDYDAILCDVRMPEVDGPVLFAWLSEHRPHLCGRMAFVTGDTLGAAAGGFLARAGRPILEKPFVPAELHRLMAELVPDHG